MQSAAPFVFMLLVFPGALPSCARKDSPASRPPSPDAATMVAAPAAAPSAALQPSPPFNVLLLTIDSLRADMPWAGYPRPIAPRLEALHRRAVDYTHAYSVSS